MLLTNIAVCLSGGIDSTTVLGLMLNQPHIDITTISFRYGSKHNEKELAAAELVAATYGVSHHIIDLRSAFAGSDSALLKQDEDIPEGHYTDKTMSRTVVPGRNLIFATSAAHFVASHFAGDRPTVLALGIHQGDHAIYPDCRPETFHSLKAAIHHGTAGKVLLDAPLLYATKTEIVEVGIMIDAPYDVTRTCYTSDELACGKCGSCNERLEAFKNLGEVDPIEYQNDPCKYQP